MPTPTGQGLLTARTLVDYAEAESGRRIVIAIIVRDVPVSLSQDLIPIVETVTTDQGIVATAFQQGY